MRLGVAPFVRRRSVKTSAARAARAWPAHTLALGCYTLLALAVTYPLPTQLGAQIIADQPGQVDGYLGIWNIWWAAHAISTARDPFSSPLLFYPQGLDLFWQTLSLPQGILALPITLTLGPLPAYNLLILASFILGGYFTFLFVRAVLMTNGQGPTLAKPLPVRHVDLAALVAGAVYAFSPFHMQKVLDAQLEVASIQWLPLFAWALLALLQRRRWPHALLAGVLLLWVGLGTWYYGLFALIYTGLAAGLWAVRKCTTYNAKYKISISHFAFRIDLRTLLWGLSPLVIWLAVMAPRLISLAQTGDRLLGDARIEQQDSAADLISFWLPNPNHPLWGAAVTRFYESLHPGSILWNVSLGLVGTCLAALGLAWSWRWTWRWAALGLAAATLATGAHLAVFGVDTGIPMPYALIRDLPGIRSSHRPNHVVLITILICALLSGVAVQRMLASRRRPWILAVSLLLAVFAVDGWVLLPPLYSRPVPRPYLSMPAPDGALLPVPLHLNFSNSENLWYQTFHHWPIIGGFIGREPPYPLGRYAPGVKELRFGSYAADDILTPGWPALARETLAAYDVRYVMFHKPAMGSTVPLMRDMVAAMGLRSTYSDDMISIYPVPRPAAPRPLVYLGAGWGDVERQSVRRWRWMGASAQLYLLNPAGAARSVTLTLDAEAFQHDRTLTVRLDNRVSFSIDITRGRMQRSLHLILPPGEHVLYLGAPVDSPPGQPARQISLAVLGISIK